jgi:hypothetical protein
MDKQKFNPGKTGPILADTNALTWHNIGEGIEIQLLRYSEVTGEYSLYVRMHPGSRIASHKHYSIGHFFITKGELKYDQGSAPKGVYGYESLGEIHNEARADELTEYFFMGSGPTAFLDQNGEVEFILDWEFYKNALEDDISHSVNEIKAS